MRETDIKTKNSETNRQRLADRQTYDMKKKKNQKREEKGKRTDKKKDVNNAAGTVRCDNSFSNVTQNCG